MGASHIGFVTFVGDALRVLFGSGFFIRTQGPLDLEESSQPQPDIAVIAGSNYDYLLINPSGAALVVEVVDSSVEYDRTTKASLYAKAGIREYWIVNLMAWQLEVFRQPGIMAAPGYSFGYGETMILRAGDNIAPLARPEARVAVVALLPRERPPES